MDIVYVVEERNRVGVVRSRLFTPSIWQAMSEWLAKVYNPIGFPPGVRVGDGRLSLLVDGCSVIIDHALYDMKAKFISDGQVVRSITLSTEVVNKKTECFYSANSTPVYLSREYSKAITKMQERISRHSANQADVAYILCLFASRDPLHHFWRPRLWVRGRGLSM